MILQARAPFDFAKSLAFTGADDNRLRKAFEIDTICVLATAYAIDDLTLDVWLDADCELGEHHCAKAYDRVAFYLSLDDDLTPFYRRAKREPKLRALLRRAYGFHHVKFATPFESACWAIITQRLAIPVARRIKDRIRDAFGTFIERDGLVYRAFPSPARLASASDADLRALGVPAPKIRYLRDSIDAFSRIDEHWLRRAPAVEVRAWLQAIAGIGEWSATLVLIRGLGRMDVDDYAHFYERAVPSFA